MFKQNLIELKEEIDKSTYIFGECQHFSPVTDKTTRPKISRDVEELNRIATGSN